ncbi:MAG TPA: ATP-binding cassette domain-containing protein, partial [Verrucomicrobiae bacterium]|nr:ATP-binding cassette domain-containing protein [Verrucomicrobiae bacterium]
MNSFIPSSPPPSSSEICEIELRGISKKFGAIQANDQVDLKARAGTIHAIVGENGAGKSTAMKILYGMLAPDAGEIVVRGKTVRFRSSADAIAAGIGMVHQHFMLAARHTALDNILVGVEPTRWGMLRRRHARRELSAFAAQYDLESWLNLPIEDLPLGVRQRVEILKLLYRKANVFILDEPTAVLTPREADGLFSNLEALKREGKTILLITHKLREVLAASDCVSIMRAGKVVAERNTADTNAEELALLM